MKTSLMGFTDFRPPIWSKEEINLNYNLDHFFVFVNLPGPNAVNTTSHLCYKVDVLLSFLPKTNLPLSQK